MHDGQNLFDTKTSYAGEWEIDETLNKLFTEKKLELIVVGIDNGGESRMDEYSPWNNKKYGGGEGDAYVDFIVNTLKPYIDSSYRTLSNKENTGIMGSSMGGLISFYAGLKYPDTFGKIAVFSPSFWFASDCFQYATEHGKINSKMYFLVGEDEGGNMVSDTEKMVEVMESNGFDKDHIYKKIVPKAQHNEQFWSSQFEQAVLWLYSN
jgi:alpha-glucosidase